MKILLLYNPNTTLDMFRVRQHDFFSNLGFTIVGEAYSAVEAIELYRKLRPVAIFTNILEVNDISVIKEVKEYINDVIIICYGNASIPENLIRFLLLNISDYICVPFSYEDFTGITARFKHVKTSLENGAYSIQMFNNEILVQLSRKFNNTVRSDGVLPGFSQIMVDDIIRFSATNDTDKSVDTFFNKLMNDYRIRQDERRHAFNKQKFSKYNISIELGRTIIADSVITVEYGRSYCDQNTIIKSNDMIPLDIEMNSDLKILHRIYLNGKCIAKGIITETMYDDVYETLTIAIFEMVDESNDVLDLMKKSAIKIKRPIIYIDREKNIKKMQYNVLANGNHLAKGDILFRENMSDDSTNVERTINILIDEICES